MQTLHVRRPTRRSQSVERPVSLMEALELRDPMPSEAVDLRDAVEFLDTLGMDGGEHVFEEPPQRLR